MMVMGVWDGHDSGAAIIVDGKIAAAVNEERFTRRKLEIRFPFNSIDFCLKRLKLSPKDIMHVAVSSSDFSITLSRAFPKIKEEYYPVRRRQKKPNILYPLNRPMLNNLGRLRQNSLFRSISKNTVRKNLQRIGFSDNINIHIVEHHLAHAASAFFCSGFKRGICITMDALGDGISASVNLCEGNQIERVAESKTKDSLGLLYQEATQLLDMRMLEDEGKVMCLSDYSEGNNRNPIHDFYKINGLDIKVKIGMERRWHILKKLKNKHNRIDFAYMVQDATEKKIEKLFSNAISELDIHDVCWAGGVASNIKANMKVFNLKNLRNGFIFPHMGDGGLAAGAGLYISSKLFDSRPYELKHVYLGPKYADQQIIKQLNEYNDKVVFERSDDITGYTAELLHDDNIVYWFNNQMEFGPRALGARSILSRPDIIDNRERLNSIIKQRENYQPFCPSILSKDAKVYLKNYMIPNRFMTTAYEVKDDYLDVLSGVMSKDNTTRPQIVDKMNNDYFDLLVKFKKLTGIGALLNTSFNIHGEPIVCSPKDAIETLIKTQGDCLIIGNYIVRKK